MKVYLVGGAVRDKLLNRPVTDHDYVVVGSTPEAMFAAGYKSVGKDFPVFLHPKTKAEYALARTERKSGRGYQGFTFNTSPDVTIEEDLSRRDLTINAIAMADNGDIVDPYNGVSDLENRILRHVSLAFCEDPVRILRIARFEARYSKLGFTVAPETMDLMKTMVADGEVDFLVAERVWTEFEKALSEPDPVAFITTLRECGALAKLMPEIAELFGVPQNPEHHPEIDTGIHTMMALQAAVSLSQHTEVRLATLLHDVGKAQTPKAELPHHKGHEARSKPLIMAFANRFKIPAQHRELALLVAKEHTACHRAHSATAEELLDLIINTDAQRRPDRFEHFLLACEADSRGRTGFEQLDYTQADLLRTVFQASLNIDNKAVVADTKDPSEIKAAIYAAKLAQVKVVLDQLCTPSNEESPKN